jgi:hypothetical protein
MRQRLSYANVMATIAVFIALGGSSYAAVKISGEDVKNNSLTGADIKNNSVRGAEIRAGAIKSDDVADGTLLSEDFESGQLPQGAQGPSGAQGPKGDTGTVDTSNFFDKASSDARFLALTAKAADSDKLDGSNSSDFMRGPGRIETYYWPHVDDGDGVSKTNQFFAEEATIGFVCKTDGTASFGLGWSGPFHWWYDDSFGDVDIGMPGGIFAANFTLGVGTEQHTFRGVTARGTPGGKTMLVQFSSHIDEDGCTFAATSQGTRDTTGTATPPNFP